MAAATVYVVAAGRTDGPARGGLTLALLVVIGLTARGSAMTLGDLGARSDRLRSGLRWGGAAGAGVVALTALAALLPGTRAFFVDDRVASTSAAEVAFEALVRIPIATALFEEVLFRGALLGLLLRQLRPDAAVGLSAALFGIWHVLSAAGFADANAGVPDGRAGTLLVVPVTVLVTGAGGALLAWVRIRSGSLAAPVIVHAAINSCALVAAWFVSG